MSGCVTAEDPVNILHSDSVVNVSLSQESGNFVQISPQYMKLKLRVGLTEKIHFKVSNFSHHEL